jgi:hypothetical protein
MNIIEKIGLCPIQSSYSYITKIIYITNSNI